ncbi:MAG: hypothetical protein RBS80_25520 [Thermoguttaceae bacterium]|jgi:hypothetical protein|nr:hypothetical protein [Thermoguttaceae bacterium]
MSTNLSRFFRQRRLTLGLRHGQVAERTGHRKCKTANLLCLFEERGDINAALFRKLQAALDITDAEVEEYLERDRREHLDAWLQWVNQPIEPHLVMRAMAGIPVYRSMPGGLKSLDEMEEFASEFAKTYHKLVWLCPGTRRFTVRFDEEGKKIEVVEATPDTITTPWMQFASSRRKFIFRFNGSVKSLTQPERHGPKG